MTPSPLLRPLSLLLALTLLAPAARADDKQVEALLAAAKQHIKIDNAMRTRLAYLQALQLDPDCVEALVGLARHGSSAEREALELQLPVRFPKDPRVAALGGARPSKGPAVELKAVYLGLGRGAPDTRSPSLSAGQPLEPRLLIAVGVDRAGRPVPIKLAVEPGKGLTRKRSGVVAGEPARRASFKVIDRRSRKSHELSMRIVGPPAQVTLRAHHAKVGKGDLLHISAGIVDAAGGRLWVERLQWSAVDAKGEALAPGKPLRDPVSRVPADIPFEPHRNVVLGPSEDQPFTGKLTVKLTEPESGASTTLAVEVIAGETDLNRESAAHKMGWTSWKEGLAQARREGKPLLVFFEGDWCPFCRKMEKTTLADDAVVAAAREHFVPVKVNADRSRAMISRFKIKDLPTLVFLSRDGLEVSRMPNDYHNRVEKVLKHLREARELDAAAAKTTAPLRAAIEREPKAVGPRLALADHYREHDQPESALQAYLAAYEIALEVGSDADKALRRVIQLELELRRYASAAKRCERFAREHGGSGYARMIKYYHALALIHGGGDRSRARALLTEVIEGNPKGSLARAARKATARYFE